ncbi:MAG: hypothetical protein K5776_08260 [Lachnospiraceae bacterium]|nr:hypothetical protein [Lachnospiraceae bacterium]
MRVATQEEDELLRKISHVVDQNYILENDLIYHESQTKGIKEQKRQSTVRVFVCLIISIILAVVLAAFLIHIPSDPALTVSLLFASGGLGFFGPGFIIYTIIVGIRHFAKTSSSDFWIKRSDKMHIENLYFLEKTRISNIRSIKKSLRDNNANLEEWLDSYFKLKEINDKKYDEDVAAGKRRPDFNFEAYNSYIDIDNDWINFNKLRVRDLRLKGRKNAIEKDLERMALFEEKCKESIRWFILLAFVIFGMAVLMLFAYIYDTGELRGMIMLAASFFIAVGGIVLIINLINLIFRLPFLSDSKFASGIAEKLGYEETKKDFNRLREEIAGIDKELIEVAASIKEYRDKNAELQ